VVLGGRVVGRVGDAVRRDVVWSGVVLVVGLVVVRFVVFVVLGVVIQAICKTISKPDDVEQLQSRQPPDTLSTFKK